MAELKMLSVFDIINMSADEILGRKDSRPIQDFPKKPNAKKVVSMEKIVKPGAVDIEEILTDDEDENVSMEKPKKHYDFPLRGDIRCRQGSQFPTPVTVLPKQAPSTRFLGPKSRKPLPKPSGDLFSKYDLIKDKEFRQDLDRISQNVAKGLEKIRCRKCGVLLESSNTSEKIVLAHLLTHLPPSFKCHVCKQKITHMRSHFAEAHTGKFDTKLFTPIPGMKDVFKRNFYQCFPTLKKVNSKLVKPAESDAVICLD